MMLLLAAERTNLGLVGWSGKESMYSSRADLYVSMAGTSCAVRSSVVVDGICEVGVAVSLPDGSNVLAIRRCLGSELKRRTPW